MAGTIIAGAVKPKITQGVTFFLAAKSDDAEIRQLLRETAMNGEVQLSLEREPDFFEDIPYLGEQKTTVIAREGNRLVCVGSCSIRSRFVNGKPQRVGYLTGLRLNAKSAGRFDVLRRGYRFFSELQKSEQADCYFTSIAEGNERAIQFLERGLPGMPVYKFLCGFATLLIPVPRGVKGQSKANAKSQFFTGGNGWQISPGQEQDVAELCAGLNSQAHDYQLSPCWTPDNIAALKHLGLGLKDFCIVRENQRMIACAAVWDQRSFKQTVVRGYSRRLAFIRPWINAAAFMAGRPGMPSVGLTLAHAPVCHLMVAEDQPAILVALIKELFLKAASKQIEFLTLGFAAGDPRLQTVLSNFPHHQYKSRLYTVRWPGTDRAEPSPIDGRLSPEVALL
ncbi:hypothetical protein [Pedosphaera parvula]|uniref:N-acetyltransferase domain-containing protein n=1 Tax=Pedosphaera parvula (strain Ellin514) TaxID=320771 RepID=B9XDZ5_PEDPL|nr:hypothetical protein [Pedosphaera parvula]EEF61886.1 hypothetical protein Cflav_PD4549 [Pedosphaera parvula Ellin514]